MAGAHSIQAFDHADAVERAESPRAAASAPSRRVGAARMSEPKPQPADVATPAPSDEDLALGARSGSMACFGELVERLGPRVHRFLLRRAAGSPGSHDSEDLVQETFVRAWDKIDRYDPSRPFITWLFAIASRLAVDHARSGGRRAARERARSAAECAPEGASPLAAADEREQRGRLWTIADRVLTPDQRSALWLRYVEDLSIAEIARVLGKTRVGVRVTLFRGRAALAERLHDPAAAPTGVSNTSPSVPSRSRHACPGGVS